MWEDYTHRYRLIAKVVSITQTQTILPDLRRYRVVIIDESHNLRNREGRRWAVIRDYIERNASKCILLSATPYNKVYLDLANQLRLFLNFPKRLPKTLTFRIHDNDPNDQYARLYSDRVVDTICLLHLPRYGLANYLKPTPDKPPTADEAEVMKNLSRAGKRLIGFCRTNLFKRLDSSGYAFLLSVRRHIPRNFIYLPDVFVEDLAKHLRQDAERLFSILQLAGEWQPDRDRKLDELYVHEICDVQIPPGGPVVALVFQR
jgi:hypothetical protein